MRMKSRSAKTIINYQFMFFILFIIFCMKSFATNLGVVGQTYPIMEEDFLIFIQNKIALMQKNGEWGQLQNQFASNVKQHADRPQAILAITPAIQTKIWNFDPSITLPRDLLDISGRVIASAGTTVNPLSFMTLHNALLFFDGDNVNQVKFAKQTLYTLKGKVKLILVNGSVMDAEKQFKRSIYFDQGGRLTNHLGIQHVPALVEQNGLKLKISEISL